MSEDSRYILAKRIARGGMAEIFLGKHVGEDGFQRLCAIKRILPHYAQDQEFIQMFRDEAHICKRLQHANIVRVEGFEEVENSYAIIMEFVDGSDLRTLLHASEQSKKKLTTPMACFIIAEASRGLHYAHTKVDEITQQPLGIVHRDISPQNILVSFEGEIKVTDFGIADADSKLTETRPGIVKGKYSYMSPEQISAKQVDARTDVFALAIVLWEMLAMRRLFQGENEVDTIQRVKNCKIDVDLRQVNPDVDEELDQIIKKGLARDPKKRYKSAADFEKDLRRHMSRRYPEFTPQDLGGYLKTVMDGRRAESAADIKKTLTETNLKAAPGRRGGSSGGKKRGVDLTMDEGKSGPPLSLNKSSLGGAGTQSRQMSVAGNTGMSNVGSRPATSQFGRTSFTRGTTTTAAAAMSRRRPGQHKTWMLGAVAAAVLCIGLIFAARYPAQSTPATLLLRTQPARVKISIDDKPVNNGRYVRASSRNPLKITLKPGKHVIQITRYGYYPYRYEFDGSPGEEVTKDDVVLREKSNLAAVKIKMKPSDKPIKFDINDGYFVATLIPNRVTAVAPDLLAGKTYLMRVTVGTGDKPFTCRLTPKSMTWRAPTEVTIDRIRRKCVISEP
jgi:serine/threonine protein kinase